MKPARTFPLLAIVIGIALGGYPSPAEAHLVNSGLGPFYDGISHFALSPECFLAVVALALLAGAAGKAQGRTALGFGSGAWLVGALSGHLAGSELNLLWLTTIPLLLGIAVALKAAPRETGIGILAVGTGFLLGFGQGAALAAGDVGISSVLGNAIPATCLLAIIAAIAVGCRKQWSRTVVRVAGSWIAAISLLTIGWLWQSENSDALPEGAPPSPEEVVE